MVLLMVMVAKMKKKGKQREEMAAAAEKKLRPNSGRPADAAIQATALRVSRQLWRRPRPRQQPPQAASRVGQAATPARLLLQPSGHCSLAFALTPAHTGRRRSCLLYCLLLAACCSALCLCLCLSLCFILAQMSLFVDKHNLNSPQSQPITY